MSSQIFTGNYDSEMLAMWIQGSMDPPMLFGKKKETFGISYFVCSARS